MHTCHGAYFGCLSRVRTNKHTVNLDFLKNYAGIDMKPRPTVSVRVNKSLVHSGDALYVTHLLSH
jgi:hypothetical protein